MQTQERSAGTDSRQCDYDPFRRGHFPVGVRTDQAQDRARNRAFPCEIWYPASTQHSGQDLAAETQDSFVVSPGQPRRQMAVRNAAAEPGMYPLIVFSHHSGGNRRAATFLCSHLSSHGYIVAALDHSEMVAPELARKDGETTEQRAARAQSWVASRVPDIRFLLDYLLSSVDLLPEIQLDRTRIGIVGHSFGGWTALAAPEVESRIHAVVALAPGGASRPRPGILTATLSFAWGRDVPTLYLAAENDTPLPLAGMYELFTRTRSARQMVTLRRADHCHFLDLAEQQHEAMRAMSLPAEFSWLSREMLPFAELCSEEQAHLFVRALTLAHMDAVLKQQEEARRFLAGDIEAELARRNISAIAHPAAFSKEWSTN